MLRTEHPITSDIEAEEITRLLRMAIQESIGDFYGGKRRHQRFRSANAFEADVKQGSERDILPVSLQDISATGVACWSRHKVARDAPMHLREFTPDDSGVWISTRVTHCTPGIRGYLIGATFEHPAGDDVLAQLAEECAALQAEPVIETTPSCWRRVLTAFRRRRDRAPTDDENLQPAATTEP